MGGNGLPPPGRKHVTAGTRLWEPLLPGLHPHSPLLTNAHFRIYRSPSSPLPRASPGPRLSRAGRAKAATFHRPFICPSDLTQDVPECPRLQSGDKADPHGATVGLSKLTCVTRGECLINVSSWCLRDTAQLPTVDSAWV